MDRGTGFGTADRRSARPAHSPRAHSGDEWRELPLEAEQAQTRLATEILTIHTGQPIERDGVFRSGLNAPAGAGLRSRRHPFLQSHSFSYSPIHPLAWFYSGLLA